jgi:pantoate--beta-alanine ligase
MRTIRNIQKTKRIIGNQKQKNKSIGFVATLGCIHQGHLSLIKKARKETDFLVVSIYVNPTQFGPGEDYNKYPRDLKKDKSLLRKESVDLLFAPLNIDIYPKDYQTYVISQGNLSKNLCGASREGHFNGVCTIVDKLFNIIKPDVSYFGQKDYQQAQIIKQMVKDLNKDVKIKVLPIVREKDGLALSSRNQYLDSTERKKAKLLYQLLKEAKDKIKKGNKNPESIKQSIRAKIQNVKDIKIDYIEIVDAKTLEKIKYIKGQVLIALAIYVGKTRLIDNILVRT